jgi:ABC-type lipoprotein release transport system permease subunit
MQPPKRFVYVLKSGLTPLDPAIFIGVAALFAIVATLAALFSAHRATRVDPLVALRNE